MATGSPDAAARRLLAGADDALAVAPRPALARATIALLRPGRAVDPPERVRLLLADDDAEAVRSDFLVAADAADAVADGRLAVRTASDLDASLTVVDGTVRALLPLDVGEDAVFGVSSGAGGTTADAVAARYERVWETAEPVDLGAPGRTALVDAFESAWPGAGDTLAGLFEAAGTLPRDGALDHVAACTLAVARHRGLVMVLGEQAEEVGLCSRSGITRAKARLVDAGLVDTERVPTGVGRPRQRLVLAGDGLADATPAELLATGREALAG